MPVASVDHELGTWFVKNLPSRREALLDVGCGVGDLTRTLEPLFGRADGIDLSAGMIEEARRRTKPGLQIGFARADLFEWLAAHRESYDCIVSVNTLHHVDFADAVRAMSQALRTGGRLLIVDLYGRSGIRHLPVNLAAYAIVGMREAIALLRGRSSWRLRLAYRRHGRSETYLTVNEVERIASEILPGARVTATLLWRYRLVWEKPPVSAG